MGKRIRRNNELSTTRVREGDKIVAAHEVSSLDSVVFLTNLGSLYSLRVLDFPSSNGYGSPIQKLLKFKDGENIIGSFAYYAEKDHPSHDSTLEDGDSILLATQRGLGFILQVEGLASIKRSGKKVIKLREEDFLADATKVHNKVAFITKRGYTLQYKSSELPSRAQVAVGVLLMSVHSDDVIVGCVSYDKEAEIELECENANPRSLSSKEIQEGRRANKGGRLALRAAIVGVKKVE